ncbi:hypothetical protein BC835DRAFT_1270798 [Cytidiella melzeri]|nr:hypothetical protein BC835DRAFT_1270798 [Cytidiella melzeri]
MIGPDLPPHLLRNRSTTSGEDDEPEAGPSQPASIGPTLPSHLLTKKPAPTPTEDEDDEDDYMPALPPDLNRSQPPVPSGPPRKVMGPSFPPSITGRGSFHDDEDDDDVGPMPLPAGYVMKEKDGVTEFLEREEKRRKEVEEAAKPKALQRDEWMLVPPSSSDLLGSIDPTKLTKGRQFQKTSAPSRNQDTSLWTETPAERQQRLADEVSGKRRRAADAVPDAEDDVEARKRRRHDEVVRKGVEEYTKKNRGGTLVDQHAAKTAGKHKDDGDEGPPKIWDHGRDMALSGRLMDDSSRDKYIKDARGLGDRFGTGKSGGFL